MSGAVASVEVWRFPLDLPAPEVERLAGVLDARERKRLAGLRDPVHRRRFAVSHARTRLVLGERLGVPPALVRLRFGPHGKPFPDGGTGAGRWHFSLSHSGDLAVLALCEGREVGVDVEEVRPERDAVRFAARWFPPDESAWVAGGEEPDRVRRCLRLWTRKEACVKAAGGRLVRGLGLPVGTGPRPRVVHGPPGFPGTWTVADLPAGPAHVGAVALCDARPFRVRDRTAAGSADPGRG
ncbi:4'-phosphopantetheinyl transferase family protein [Streptomyces sp. SHP 1-2]|uniref:4'-phosphopantetheinyl transferase family protein n=1 Tax=Streptomyces sp. SHP 1-2 TaxID=2769489 RepID=UPI002238BD8B|nr:4'-phosphopantetheinyl transferase superfamily protein [Streptomyces sp. SHP 1-2]MCW5253527.1 4'-phosphopantetheinyl transferase superfamily protein [Streptomyces sp. SHP 1-2]